MISAFVPTLKKPSKSSTNWYRNFHNSFYISQLVNNILLSYMDSFIEIVSLKEIIFSNNINLEKSGAITKSLESDLSFIDRSKLYSEDVELGLNELISKIKTTAKEHHHILKCRGLDFGGYMDREIDISLDDLKDSVDSENWYETVKGFLNVWEFIFLFSIAESTLKEIVGDYNYNTSDLISKVLKTEKKLTNIMSSNHNINKKFMLTLWDLLCSIRNIYSHTHGVISTKNKEILIRKANCFKPQFESAFHENLLLRSIIIKTEDIFNFEQISINKFYLIPDEELNIFRNFLSEFMTSLDDLSGAKLSLLKDKNS